MEAVAVAVAVVVVIVAVVVVIVAVVVVMVVKWTRMDRAWVVTVVSMLSRPDTDRAEEMIC